jgi:hypothetical protein
LKRLWVFDYHGVVLNVRDPENSRLRLYQRRHPSEKWGYRPVVHHLGEEHQLNTIISRRYKSYKLKNAPLKLNGEIWKRVDVGHGS